jgi:hypothetical protein
MSSPDWDIQTDHASVPMVTTPHSARPHQAIDPAPPPLSPRAWVLPEEARPHFASSSLHRSCLSCSRHRYRGHRQLPPPKLLVIDQAGGKHPLHLLYISYRPQTQADGHTVDESKFPLLSSSSARPTVTGGHSTPSGRANTAASFNDLHRSSTAAPHR